MGMSATMIFGPYFFEQEGGKALTVNTARYVVMLEQVFGNETLNNLSDHFYQQDGATCHTSLVAMTWLEDNFPGRLISDTSDFPWPPNSPDINPFEANQQSVDQIKEIICDVVASISQETLTTGKRLEKGGWGRVVWVCRLLLIRFLNQLPTAAESPT